VADKQFAATRAALSFQKEWFANLRRRVFEERQPYALLQADVPFELFNHAEQIVGKRRRLRRLGVGVRGKQRRSML
jgi:hypothetical protein